MSTLGIPELFVIAAMVVLPCLGVLVVAGVIIAVVALTRKNQEKSN